MCVCVCLYLSVFASIKVCNNKNQKFFSCWFLCWLMLLHTPHIHLNLHYMKQQTHRRRKWSDVCYLSGFSCIWMMITGLLYHGNQIYRLKIIFAYLKWFFSAEKNTWLKLLTILSTRISSVATSTNAFWKKKLRSSGEA